MGEVSLVGSIAMEEKGRSGRKPKGATEEKQGAGRGIKPTRILHQGGGRKSGLLQHPAALSSCSTVQDTVQLKHLATAVGVAD